MHKRQENVLQPSISPRPGIFDCAAGKVVDDWFGLRFLNDKELEDLKESETKYLQSSLQHTSPLAQEIFQEAKTKIASHPEIDYPTRIASTNTKLFSRTNPDQEYPTYFLASEETTNINILRNNLSGCTPILDLNVLASLRGDNGYDVGDIDVQDNILAYTECLDGSENYHIISKNLTTGEETFGPNGFAGDLTIVANQIIATRLDATMRPHMVVSLSLDTFQEKVIYTEKDPHKWVSFETTIDEDWLIVSSSSHKASNVLLYKVNKSSDMNTTFVLYHETPQDDETHYAVDAHGEHVIVIIDCINGENYITDIEGKILVPHRDNHHIVDAEVIVFSSRSLPTIVCTIRSQGKIWVECWQEGNHTRIQHPHDCDMTVAYLDHVDDSFIVSTESWTVSEVLYQINVSSWEPVFLHEWEIPGYDDSKYAWRTENVQVRDGELVPISMVWNTQFSNKPLPALVYVYGAYGSSLDAWWSASRVSLMDRGIMFVVVHARGGGENGRLWHEAGRKEHKLNTMNDIIDCVLYLQHNNIISTAVLRGGSAGGGAVAATANFASAGLFHGYIAEVPFVDVLATMSDSKLPLTVGEYNEWGNPETIEGYSHIIQWDPMRNMKEPTESYPPFFIVCGLNDPRVGFWEGLKFAAKLRSHNINNIAYVRLDDGTGHFGASGRFESLQQEAELLAFVYDCLKGETQE